MLTHKDRIRLRLKECEFHSPKTVIQACYKFGLVDNPFVTKDHELKCMFSCPKGGWDELAKIDIWLKLIPCSSYSL